LVDPPARFELPESRTEAALFLDVRGRDEPEFEREPEDRELEDREVEDREEEDREGVAVPPDEFAFRPDGADSSTESLLTSLLKLLVLPFAIFCCTTRARLLSSNCSNHSSQLTSSRESPPLYPGKSRRMIPISPSPSVLRTAAGFAPLSSAHRRISS